MHELLMEYTLYLIPSISSKIMDSSSLLAMHEYMAIGLLSARDEMHG